MPLRTWVTTHDEILNHAVSAWDWTRELPEYQRDYRLMKKQKRTNLLMSPDPDFEKLLRRRWGVFPLPNPQAKTPSLEFIVGIGKLVNLNPYLTGARAKDTNFSMVVKGHYYKNSHYWKRDSMKPLPLLPREILMGLDPTKPVENILHQVREFLTLVRSVYNIKDSRPRTNDLLDQYKYHVKNSLGYERKDIESELLPPGTVSKDSEESLKKRLYRLRKKIAAVDAKV